MEPPQPAGPISVRPKSPPLLGIEPWPFQHMNFGVDRFQHPNFSQFFHMYLYLRA